MEIARIKMELKQSKKKIIALVINTVSFENFLRYAWTSKYDLQSVQLEFYSKVVGFLDLFVRIQTLMQEEKNFQENNEGLMVMIYNIETFEEVHKYPLSQIPEMTLKDKKYYIRSCNQCIKRAQILGHKASKLCGLCNEVGSYNDTLIEYI